MITPPQARFLRFFLSGPPDRALWLRDGKRLAVVTQPFSYHDAATHLMVYRLADGEGAAFPGEAIDRTRIALADLRPLWSYWTEPARTLNTRGEDVARARLPKRSRVCSFRQTEAERAMLATAAARAGLPPAVIVAELVASYLEKIPQGLKTPVAENGKGRIA